MRGVREDGRGERGGEGRGGGQEKEAETELGGGGERGLRGRGWQRARGKPEGDGACMLTDATGCRSPL